MKHIFLLITLLVTIASASIFAAPALAYSPLGAACSGSNATACEKVNQVNDPITGANGILMKVVNLLSIAAGVIAVVMIMVAGIKFVTSGGESNKVSSAKNTILYSVVGLVVIVLARTVIAFVINKVG